MKIMAEVGAAPSVISVMDAHGSQPGIQEDACHALATLSQRACANRAMLSLALGIPRPAGDWGWPPCSLSRWHPSPPRRCTAPGVRHARFVAARAGTAALPTRNSSARQRARQRSCARCRTSRLASSCRWRRALRWQTWPPATPPASRGLRMRWEHRRCAMRWARIQTRTRCSSRAVEGCSTSPPEGASASGP